MTSTPTAGETGIARQSWRDRAACLREDPQLFDPPSHTDDATRLLAALSICQGCPVRDLCLLDGITAHESGVWGGRLLDYGKPRALHPTTVRTINTRLKPAVDEIAVERLMAGTLHLPINTKGAELREAVRRLAAVGVSDDVIGQRVGRSSATVCKMRSRLNIPNGTTHARFRDGGWGLLSKPSHRARRRGAA